VGKRGNFVFLANEDVTVSWGADYQETSPVHIPGATMMYTRQLAHEYPFQRLSQGEDSDFFTRVRLDGGLLYSTHRYNFVRNRHGDHSFDKPDAEFLAEADGEPTPGFDYQTTEIAY
jgi:hypothetical protein